MIALSPQIAVLCGVGAVAGAVVGSFLNVVIHRTPRLIDAADGQLTTLGFLGGLSVPCSHCPHCRIRIAWHDDIPILGFLRLGGRCRYCHESYGFRYLVVEALCAAAFAASFVLLGLTLQAFLVAIFAGGLIALSAIDIEEQLLPDAVLSPLFVLGIAFHILNGTFEDGALGAIAGYGALWLIREAGQRMLDKEGLGYGDVKFAAAIGAWVGLAGIPLVLATAFVAGVTVMLPLMLAGRITRHSAVPFGPFLALGGFVAMALPWLPDQVFGPLLPY